MQYAIVNGERREAEQGLQGYCPCCEQQMVSKCGDIKIKHWAHKGKRICDLWWENETEWHREWKSHFPKEWQEIIHHADSGEKHIADIKTDQGWIIEFQHSYLKPEERKSRNDFYKKLVWVVDGKRLKRDWPQFVEGWNRSVVIGNSPVRKISSESCRILKDWSNDTAPVFIDFGKNLNQPENSILFVVMPRVTGEMVNVMMYPRSKFLEMHLNPLSLERIEFEKLLNDWPSLVQNYYQVQEHNQRVIASNALRARSGRRHFRL